MKPYQTKVWTTKDGTDIPLADMTPEHRRNALAHTLRHAAMIESQVTMQELVYLATPRPTVTGIDQHGAPIPGPPVNMMPSGEMAQDAFDAAMDERARNPRQFVTTLPLVQELLRLVGLDAVDGQ